MLFSKRPFRNMFWIAAMTVVACSLQGCIVLGIFVVEVLGGEKMALYDVSWVSVTAAAQQPADAHIETREVTAYIQERETGQAVRVKHKKNYRFTTQEVSTGDVTVSLWQPGVLTNALYCGLLVKNDGDSLVRLDLLSLEAKSIPSRSFPNDAIEVSKTPFLSLSDASASKAKLCSEAAGEKEDASGTDFAWHTEPPLFPVVESNAFLEIEPHEVMYLYVGFRDRLTDSVISDDSQKRPAERYPSGLFQCTLVNVTNGQSIDYRFQLEFSRNLKRKPHFL